MKKSNSLNFILFVLLSLFAQCTMENQKPDNPIRLTALNSMQRAIPWQAVEGSPIIDIKAAKNEYEAFQVVISAGNEDHLKNVKVTISDLEGENGRISPDNISLFRA